MEEQETFYAVRFDTGDTYEVLKYIHTKDEILEYIKNAEAMYNVSCEIKEIDLSLIFSWYDQSGKHINTECERDMWLPAFASLEEFS